MTFLSFYFINLFFQINLVDAFETSKMLLLKFDTLPGTDVITYLAEKSTYSEQMVADIASQVNLNVTSTSVLMMGRALKS